MKRQHTIKLLTVDAAVAIIGAGGSTRNILQVVREVMRRSHLILCPIEKGDPYHFQAFMTALNTFADGELFNEGIRGACVDCPSVGCNPENYAAKGGAE